MVKEKTEHKKRKNFVRHNEQIKISPVLVVQDGNNLGEMTNRDALALARSLNMDLVEVSPNQRPPVCQIMDYGKFMYDKGKKEKQKGHSPKEKEVEFRYVIGDHDLETKANQIRGFLQKGMKVKAVVKFEKREKAHKDQGFILLTRLLEMLKDVATVEKAPGFEGGNVTARLDIRKETKKEASKKDGSATNKPKSSDR
jgi:translation initiation factor IF-3